MGNLPNSALDAMLDAYLFTPNIYLQNLVCILSGRKFSHAVPEGIET